MNNPRLAAIGGLLIGSVAAISFGLGTLGIGISAVAGAIAFVGLNWALNVS